MDGVLVDARDLHYHALNRALSEVGDEFVISREEHLSTYDGLSTTKKLAKLTEDKNLSPDKHDEIWKHKQDHTNDIIANEFTWDERLRGILRRFKSEGYTIAVASN